MEAYLHYFKSPLTKITILDKGLIESHYVNNDINLKLYSTRTYKLLKGIIGLTQIDILERVDHEKDKYFLMNEFEYRSYHSLVTGNWSASPVSESTTLNEAIEDNMAAVEYIKNEITDLKKLRGL